MVRSNLEGFDRNSFIHSLGKKLRKNGTLERIDCFSRPEVVLNNSTRSFRVNLTPRTPACRLFNASLASSDFRLDRIVNLLPSSFTRSERNSKEGSSQRILCSSVHSSWKEIKGTGQEPGLEALQKNIFIIIINSKRSFVWSFGMIWAF